MSQTGSNGREAPLRVLIVEDEVLVGLEIKEILTDLGLDAYGPFASGALAVEMADRFDADLLITDVDLSDDIDGILAARAIVGRKPIPVIFLTTGTDGPARTRMGRMADAQVLVKPLMPAALRAAVTRVLRVYS